MSKSRPSFELRTRRLGKAAGRDEGRFVVEEWIEGKLVNSFGPIPGPVVEAFVALRRSQVHRTMTALGYTKVFIKPPKPLIIQ